MRKKVVSLILAAVMAGTMLAGCGGSGDSTQTEQSAEMSDSSDATSYTMFMRNTYVKWINELKWYDAAEENTGIHVEYVEGPDDFNDVYAEIDQRIISNTLPDAVMTKLAQTNVYGPQGAFVDLAPYISEYATKIRITKRL